MSKSYSQDIPKNDRIIYSGDSSFVAVYKGKKAGIYNLQQGRFDLKMAKQEVVYSPYLDYFTVFSNEGYKTYSAANTEILEPVTFFKPHTGGAKYELQEMGNTRVILRNVACPFIGLENKDDFSFDYENPFQGSGMYNLKTKKWEIPRKYSDITRIGNAIFALKHQNTQFIMNDDLGGIPEFIGAYDIYLANNKGTWALFQENVEEIRMLNMKEIFGYEDIIPQPEMKSHYRFKKEVGEKTFDYAVFNLFESDISWIPQPYLEIVQKEVDYSLINQEENYLVTYSKADTFALKLFGFEDYKKPKDSAYFKEVWDAEKELKFYSKNYRFGWIKADAEQFDIGLLDKKDQPRSLEFGITVLNEYLLKIHDVGYEKFTRVSTDTLESNWVHIQEPNGSYSRSGIFNLKTNKWEVDPYQSECYIGRKYKAYAYFEHKEPSHTEFTNVYTIYDLNDNAILENVDQDSLNTMPWFIQDIIWEIDIDTLYPCRNENQLYDWDQFYYHSEGKMGVIRAYDFMNEDYWISPSYDFLYNDDKLYFQFVIEDSTMFLNYGIDSSSVKAEGGAIFLEFIPSIYLDYYDRELSAIWVKGIENGDSVNLFFEEQEYYYLDRFFFGLQMDHNKRLVLNDSIYELRSTRRNKDMKHDNIFYDIEGSAIWEKIDGAWMKVSPYYSFIQPVKGGYICKTGAVRLDGETRKDTVFVPFKDSRYLILDNNLKPVSFIDYYDFPLIEDLGFGLKITTDRGAMFVTYELKAITDDNWTQFKLMNDGRLMAIGKKNVKSDPNDPNVKDGVVGYFRLPPAK